MKSFFNKKSISFLFWFPVVKTPCKLLIEKKKLTFRSQVTFEVFECFSVVPRPVLVMVGFGLNDAKYVNFNFYFKFEGNQQQPLSGK